MSPITVLFFGPQGSGKGTQVKLLMESLQKRDQRKIIHIDMGQLLRNIVATGSYTGQLTKEVIENGHLMPDFMPIYLTEDALMKQFTGEEHIVADGLPRRPDQTRAWDDAMLFYKRQNYQIVALELSEAESIKRLLARGRNDDTEVAIRQRLSWHKSEVEPQLQFLEGERKRKVHRINGDQSIEMVHQDILKALKLS